LSKTLVTDPDKITLSSDSLSYKYTDSTESFNSVLCEPVIPLEGTHSFSAIYTSDKNGGELIGLAQSTFVEKGWIIGYSANNSWAYRGDDGGIYLNDRKVS